MNFLRLADATAPVLLLGYGIGRDGMPNQRRRRLGHPQPLSQAGMVVMGASWVWAYAYPNNVNAVYGPRAAGYTGKLINPATQPWPAFEATERTSTPPCSRPDLRDHGRGDRICIPVGHAKALDGCARQNLRRVPDVQRTSNGSGWRRSGSTPPLTSWA